MIKATGPGRIPYESRPVESLNVQFLNLVKIRLGVMIKSRQTKAIKELILGIRNLCNEILREK